MIKFPRLSEQMRRYFKKPLHFIAKTLYFYVVFAMECKNIVSLQHENKMESWNI